MKRPTLKDMIAKRTRVLRPRRTAGLVGYRPDHAARPPTLVPLRDAPVGAVPLRPWQRA
jgi:hypothetical protein